MSEENNNLELWNKVCETNPAHTKKVTFGRGFTAIDPMQQVKNMTERFGPAGQGWGWEVRDTAFLQTDQVGILISLWVKDAKNSKRIEQWGQCGMYIDNAKKKTDDECMKKATTDGLTKCMSYMGFNADVFLGLFDDNKYVAQMREKYSETTVKSVSLSTEVAKSIVKAVTKINDCKTLNDLTEYKASGELMDIYNSLPVTEKNGIAKIFMAKEKELC